MKPRPPRQIEAAQAAAAAPMFVTWRDDETKGIALAALGMAYSVGEQTVLRTVANNSFKNVAAPNTSVRDGFDRRDYDYFRPNEALPTEDNAIIRACMQAYTRFPMVKDIIDLMGDFLTKGIDVVHPKPRVEKLGKEWFKKVGGPERSERIANMLFRAGTVVISRQNAQLPDTTLDVLRTQAALKKKPDVPLRIPHPLPPGQIPGGYIIRDPATLDVIGGQLVPFIGKQALRYSVRIPLSLARKLANSKSSLVKMLPADVLKAATSVERSVPLDPNKTISLHYKKDDHQVWATPMLYALLDDLQQLSRLKLADKAALDGVISHIRLWRLGNLQHKILPNPAAIQRLAEMLLNNVGGGSMDLIWGPQLELTETDTEVHKFLGIDKYIPTLNAIFQGLGVPPTLTGMAESGFTNNFISLRTLTERLEYGRMIVRTFWEGELALVQRVFGFAEPFTLTFDQASLSDEAAEKKLFIDLADRDYISVQFLQERFGAVPEIEKVRINREHKARKAGTAPPKAGPYHADSQHGPALEKSFVSQGVLTPSEVGISLKDKKAGEKSPLEIKGKQREKEIAAKPAPAPPTPPGAKPGGRPVGSKDVNKRKQKVVKVRQTVKASAWAGDAYDRIVAVTQPAYLQAKGKTTMRALSASQNADFERYKLAVLCAMPYGIAVNEQAVVAAASGKLLVPAKVDELCRETTADYVLREGSEPSVETARRIQVAAVAAWHTGVNENEPQGE